jgi:hypothetical protein
MKFQCEPGRFAANRTMTDPRKLLMLYDQDATGRNGLKRWLPELVAGFGLK